METLKNLVTELHKDNILNPSAITQIYFHRYGFGTGRFVDVRKEVIFYLQQIKSKEGKS